MLHSEHRCLRRCLWNSVITGRWWSRTLGCISLPHIHRHPMEMEHYGAGSLWYLLCGNKVELLSTRIWHFVCNDHKSLQKFLNGKNANNKVNRWCLELATYNITFELISGAHNKAADCISQLVDIKDMPANATTSINMLVTSTPDGPATHTYSKTHDSSDTTPSTNVTTTSTTDKVNAPPPIMEDWKDILQLMLKMDPFCKHISKRLLSGKVPLHQVDTLYTLKVSFTSTLWIQIKQSFHFMALVETHDKLGHQAVNRSYHLIKCQYYWKEMNKNICKYINNWALCKREKARHRYIHNRWQIYLIDPLTK